MKIIVLSAHPDDAETGTGGFCTRASKDGHEVLIVHISKEVRGNKVNGLSEAKVRTACTSSDLFGQWLLKMYGKKSLSYFRKSL